MTSETVRVTALRLDGRDNVATAIEDITTQAIIATAAEPITIALHQPLPMGHKLALSDIPAGFPIIKYGEVIGHATSDIVRGQHVHVHNVKGARARG